MLYATKYKIKKKVLKKKKKKILTLNNAIKTIDKKNITFAIFIIVVLKLLWVFLTQQFSLFYVKISSSIFPSELRIFLKRFQMQYAAMNQSFKTKCFFNTLTMYYFKLIVEQNSTRYFALSIVIILHSLLIYILESYKTLL